MMDIADGLAAEVYFAQLAFLASDDCDGSRCQEHALPELYRRHIQQMRQCHTGDAEMAEADDDGFAVCFIRSVMSLKISPNVLRVYASGHSTNLIINRKLSARLHKHAVSSSFYYGKLKRI